jgi:hypothetical protein
MTANEIMETTVESYFARWCADRANAAAELAAEASKVMQFQAVAGLAAETVLAGSRGNGGEAAELAAATFRTSAWVRALHAKEQESRVGGSDLIEIQRRALELDHTAQTAEIAELRAQRNWLLGHIK